MVAAMHVYAWSHERSARLGPLLSTAEKQSVRVDLIGLGLTPDPGYFFKHEALESAIEALGDDEVVLVTDGFDVLYQLGADVIERRFVQRKVALLFCAERQYWHQEVALERHYLDRAPQGTIYPYLNAGAMIGFVGALRRMLRSVRDYPREASLARGVFNDQTLVGRYAAENPDEVALDYGADLFWCLGNEWRPAVRRTYSEGGGLINPFTLSEPALLHVTFLKYTQPVRDRLFHRIMRSGTTGERAR